MQFPTVFVIFGITGDLMRKKILRGLYNLYLKKLLPKKLKIYGFSRKPHTHDSLRLYLHGIMEEDRFTYKNQYDKFLSLFFYVQGNFDNKDAYTFLAEMFGYHDGAWSICTNKLFYLAVPPSYYQEIFLKLSESGFSTACCDGAWTRVVVEKPFGKDLQTAKELDKLLGKLFTEEQIYRVDHYLAKETVRNILAFRFSNSFLIPSWNSQHIEKIEVKLLEKEQVGDRGMFYDGVGALRDIGQNHMLQLLSLFVMDNPGVFTADAIRKKRREVFASLHTPRENEISEMAVRGQYTGYTKEKNIQPRSKTETYFRIKTFLNKSVFEGVPIYLEGGKAVNVSRTEVIITFKHKAPCLCPPGEHFKNILYYTIRPDEKIVTKILVKKPGYDYIVGRQNFEFDYKKAYKKSEFIEDYEQLILDIFKGDQTLFVSTEEILDQWKFIEPIVEYWKKDARELISYEIGERPDNPEKEASKTMEKAIGIVGLGKMGGGVVLQLLEKKWDVAGYNRSPEKIKHYAHQGMIPAYSIQELVKSFPRKKIIWLMLPAGKEIDAVIFGKDGLAHVLKKGDVIVDAGNSYFKDSKRRGEELAKKGIGFVDIGVSGGPAGARYGACLMVGGSKELYQQLLPLYQDIALSEGVSHFEGFGAGHFVKMVHNGIEYGMMQAIAEGFGVLKESDYKLDLQEVARIYNNGSVIASRLIAWLKKAFREHGTELKDISGAVQATGEGEWTVKTAKEKNISVPVIEKSLDFRKQSHIKPSYIGKIVSALRGQFGGHKVS